VIKAHSVCLPCYLENVITERKRLLDIKPVFCFLVGSSVLFLQNMGLEGTTSYLSKVS